MTLLFRLIRTNGLPAKNKRKLLIIDYSVMESGEEAVYQSVRPAEKLQSELQATEQSEAASCFVCFLFEVEPSSSLSARCKLAYGTYGWPLYYSLPIKANGN